MAAASVTTFDKMLKIWYDEGRVKQITYRDNPFLALCPKATDFRGKSRAVPIWYRAGQGVSATFATAQANASAGGYENFLLTRVRGYGVGQLENELIEAAVGKDKGAFMSATAEMEGLFHEVTRDLAIAMYREEHGSRGIISTIASGDGTDDRVALTNPSDVTNFEVGMWLEAVTPNGSGVPVAGNISSFPYKIGRIDRQLGYLYMVDAAGASVDLNTTSNWANGDHLIRQGDITASSATLKLSGLASWLPATAALVGTLFGVDRSEDVTRLGGVRVDGTGMSVEDALIQLSTALRVEGARPDICLMNPLQMRNLIREMGSTVTREVVKAADANIGFEAVVLFTPSGRIKVVEDPNCPVDIAYMLTLDTWKLYSMGGAPKFLTYDGDGSPGSKWLRVSDADTVEYRIGWYGQMGCNAPGHNGRVSLSV